ncbi:MAG: peptidoglycan-binding protein [Candidatus Pacebacteria bacterium]|nr:peptidoglycan-binding protein [Candidatus Paceibacterota bacterium]
MNKFLKIFITIFGFVALFTLDAQAQTIILSPNGGEELTVGQSYTIQWDTTGYSSDVLVQLGIYDIRYSTEGGPYLEKLVTNTTNTGSYTWTIPSDLYADYDTDTPNHKIKIYIDGNYVDESNEPFYLTFSIDVVGPNKDDIWVVGGKYRVSWQPFFGPVSTDTFVYLTGADYEKEYIKYIGSPSGTPYSYIDYHVEGSDVGPWWSPNWKVVVCNGKYQDGGSNCGFSGEMCIKSNVISPKEGEEWSVGSTYRVSWEPFAGPISTDTFVYLTGGGYEKEYIKYMGSPIGTSYIDYKAESSDVGVDGSSWKVAVCNGKYQDYGSNCGLSGQVYITEPSNLVCATYFRTESSDRMIQGTWTDDPQITSSISSCYNYVNTDLLYKTNCAQPGGVYLTAALIDKSKHTYEMPSIDMTSEFVYGGFCPTEPILINSATIISPNGGEKLTAGQSYTIQWDTEGYYSDASVQLGIYDTRYAAGNSLYSENIVTDTRNTWGYTWTIPSDLIVDYDTDLPNHKIKIYINGNYRDESDEPFYLLESQTQTTQVIDTNTETVPVTDIDDETDSVTDTNIDTTTVPDTNNATEQVQINDLQITITALLAQINILKESLAALDGSAKLIGGSSKPVSDPVKSIIKDVDTGSIQSVCLKLKNNLKYRSRDIWSNDEVSSLQDFLRSNNYLDSESTGYFGPLTEKAVKDFQYANGIDSTGFFGPITRSKIVSLTCE